MNVGFLVVILSACICSLGIADEQEMVWRYTVRPGDSLMSLAKTHLLHAEDWREMQRYNHIKNPNSIKPGMVLKVPLALVKTQPTTAEVVSISGQADFQLIESAQPLQVGQHLPIGSKIMTKAQSKVVVKFADGSLTSVGSNAILLLDSMSVYSGGAMVDTKLRLQQGRVETQANPNHQIGNHLQITTPSAIAAVRGTRFRVAADEASIKQETLEGQVAFTSLNQEVLIDKGYGSVAEVGKIPSAPILLLAAVDTTHFATKFETLPIHFDMPQQTGAVEWLGQVYTDANAQQMIAEVTAKNQQMVFKELPKGQYYLKLNAIDKLGLSGYDTLHAFAVDIKEVEKMSPPLPDISNMQVSVIKNRVYVSTISPVNGYTYQVRLDNPFNHQQSVWSASGLQDRFDFLLKEYGSQRLSIKHVDAEGVAGPEAVYEFDAKPQ